MIKRIVSTIALIVGLGASVALAANCGGATACACGDTVTSYYKFSSDLHCLNGSGLALADGVTVSGYGYTLSGTVGTDNVGLNFTNADNSSVKNLRVTGFKYCARFVDATGNSIKHSELFSCGGSGVGYGVQMGSGAVGNTILGTVVRDHADEGIHIGSGAYGNTVRNSQVYRSASEQIYLLETHDNIIDQNVAWGGSNSLFVKESYENVFSANSFQSNTARLQDDSDSNTFSNDDFVDTQLRFATGSDNNYGAEISFDNPDGTCLNVTASTGNEFEDSSFASCGTDVACSTSGTTTITTSTGVDETEDDGNCTITVN